MSNTLPQTLCYLNGDYTPLKDAKISVLDRGFIFGDGVYEVVPAYAGKLFRFDQHMARLDRSLTELRIANPMTPAEWHEVATKLIADYARIDCASGPGDIQRDQIIYIQISRGVAMRDHAMPPGLKPTVFVMTNAMKLPSLQQRAQGVPASRRRIFGGRRRTSKAPACWGRCSLGRSASTRAQPKPSCSEATF